MLWLLWLLCHEIFGRRRPRRINDGRVGESTDDTITSGINGRPVLVILWLVSGGVHAEFIRVIL